MTLIVFLEIKAERQLVAVPTKNLLLLDSPLVKPRHATPLLTVVETTPAGLEPPIARHKEALPDR